MKVKVKLSMSVTKNVFHQLCEL